MKIVDNVQIKKALKRALLIDFMFNQSSRFLRFENHLRNLYVQWL